VTDVGGDADPRRRVPRTDAALADGRLASAIDRLGRDSVKIAVRRAQQRVRSEGLEPHLLVDLVLQALPPRASSLRPVLNATGAVLHTNLGRAALSGAALDALVAAAGPVDIEFDLATGRRAARGRGTLAALRTALPDAGDVLVVGNGAAALLLAVTALCPRRTPEVIWSRGELVEIGDGFRLSDLVAATGARPREVGSTNRTCLDDYRAAIGSRTGCVLKVHPSNFTVTGFTSQVPVRDLAGLGPPLVVDVGSGLLSPDALLPDEPDLTTALRAGADVVTGSADKLMGGPQAGIVGGRADLLARMRRHPLARALRVDKLTLAALEATLTGPPAPTFAALHQGERVLLVRAQQLAARLARGGLHAEAVPSEGVVGGGGAPGLRLPGWAVALPTDLAAPLRRGEPAVVGRVEGGRLLLDLRAVGPEQDGALAAAVLAAGGLPVES